MTRRGIWLAITVALVSINVTNAALFDWSDVRIHITAGALCIVAARRWPRGATVVSASIALATILSLATWSEPAEFARVRTGDDWRELQRSLGPPAYEAPSLAQARMLAAGYSSPNPLRFRQAGLVAIFIRGEYALWVVHDDRSVKMVFVGGS